MQKLVTGIHEFQETVFTSQQNLLERLSRGQSPLALFITCSDSRICPNTLTQTGPGELFIMRNAGNIVPPYGAGLGGEAATIEYAISVLGIRDVIVCGHSHCGAMAALIDPPTTAKLPAVRQWLSHAESTRRIIEENYVHVESPERRLVVTIEENVLVQIEHLRTHPSVAAALSRGALNLHGWVNKFETGEVFAYSPEQEQFVRIADLAEMPLAEVSARMPAF